MVREVTQTNLDGFLPSENDQSDDQHQSIVRCLSQSAPILQPSVEVSGEHVARTHQGFVGVGSGHREKIQPRSPCSRPLWSKVNKVGGIHRTMVHTGHQVCCTWRKLGLVMSRWHCETLPFVLKIDVSDSRLRVVYMPHSHHYYYQLMFDEVIRLGSPQFEADVRRSCDTLSLKL